MKEFNDINKHERDARLHFDAASHTYTLNGTVFKSKIRGSAINDVKEGKLILDVDLPERVTAPYVRVFTKPDRASRFYIERFHLESRDRK